MDSGKSNQLRILGEKLKQKTVDGVHPISLLNECSQITGVPLVFKEGPCKEKGIFMSEVRYGDNSSTGSGNTKKEAKTNAAKHFISQALQSLQSNDEAADSVEVEGKIEEHKILPEPECPTKPDSDYDYGIAQQRTHDYIEKPILHE